MPGRRTSRLLLLDPIVDECTQVLGVEWLLRLPSDDEIDEGLRQVADLITADPMAGREALRGLLVDGRIVLVPLPEGVCEARAELLLGGVLLGETKTPPGGAGRRGYTPWVAGARYAGHTTT